MSDSCLLKKVENFIAKILKHKNFHIVEILKHTNFLSVGSQGGKNFEISDLQNS